MLESANFDKNFSENPVHLKTLFFIFYVWHSEELLEKFLFTMFSWYAVLTAVPVQFD